MPAAYDKQRGSVEILVMALLRERPMFGYEIIRELAQRSEGFFTMEEGHLYPICIVWSGAAGRRPNGARSRAVDAATTR